MREDIINPTRYAGGVGIYRIIGHPPSHPSPRPISLRCKFRRALLRFSFAICHCVRSSYLNNPERTASVQTLGRRWRPFFDLIRHDSKSIPVRLRRASNEDDGAPNSPQTVPKMRPKYAD